MVKIPYISCRPANVIPGPQGLGHFSNRFVWTGDVTTAEIE